MALRPDLSRKRLTDLEAKLKAAVADRQAAVAEKATLEKQVKQQQGQKMLIEKSLEKKDQIESKKRESIMIVSIRDSRPIGSEIVTSPLPNWGSSPLPPPFNRI